MILDKDSNSPPRGDRGHAGAGRPEHKEADPGSEDGDGYYNRSRRKPKTKPAINPNFYFPEN